MKLCKLFFFLNFMVLITGCNGQENPEYIGKAYGTFELDRITFKEKPAFLFSKVNQADLILITGKDSYFDTLQNKQIWTDTIEYIYRIRHAKVDGLYAFKGFKIKDKVVSFYTDHQKRFRRVDVSFYMTKEEYKNLMDKTKDYKDITTKQIRDFNNGKYNIFEKIDGTKKTLLYCTEMNDQDGEYFIKVRMNDLKIVNDKFDQKWNSKWGF